MCIILLTCLLFALFLYDSVLIVLGAMFNFISMYYLLAKFSTILVVVLNLVPSKFSIAEHSSFELLAYLPHIVVLSTAILVQIFPLTLL